MKTLETAEFAAKLQNRSNEAAAKSPSVESLESRIELLKNFVRRRPQISAGVLSYWLRNENS
jgi:hypothetical protein